MTEKFPSEDPYSTQIKAGEEHDGREASSVDDGDVNAEASTRQTPASQYATRLDESIATFGDAPVANEGSATNFGAVLDPLGRSAKMRFRILRSHAKGGLGKVSVAHDSELRRHVAVKEIQERYADLPESQSRFVFEAEVTGRLEHPGIVPVYALGKNEDGRPFYAMRFVSGKSMDQAIRELHDGDNDRSKFDRGLRELLNRFISVCNTIDFAHSRGYLHRDIKPANVMLGEYAETLVVDWGLAKHISLDSAAMGGGMGSRGNAEGAAQNSDRSNERAGKTRIGRAVGTPYYMAPEQALGESEKIAPHTDIYSLGATLYHILTGSAPLSDQGRMPLSELIRRVGQGEIPPAIEVRPATRKKLNAICRAAMAVDPAARYRSARALAEDIENELADEPVSVMPEMLTDRCGRWMRKHRGITATAAVSLLTLALVSTAFYLVTQSALRRTQRYLQISQNEQRFDSMIHDEVQRRGLANLDADALVPNSALVETGATLIQKIEAMRHVEDADYLDANRRQSLLRAWIDGIEAISRRRMDRTVQQTLVGQIDRFESEFPFRDLAGLPSEVDRLRGIARQRISQWYPVDLPPLRSPWFDTDDGLATRLMPVANDPNASTASEPSLPTPDGDLVLLAPAPTGNVQLSAEFAGDLSQAKSLGLALNQSGRVGYQFLIADQSYHPIYGSEDRPTIAESSRAGGLTAFIIRGEDVLRVAPVESARRFESAGGALPKLIARRERGTLLTFIIGQQQLRFDDLFPLPVSDPGQVGLVCPPHVAITQLAMESQTPADLTTKPDLNRDPIELGDEAFAQGKLVMARQFYERLPNDVEALAKTAMTLEFLEPDQYPVVLERIVDEFSPEGVEDERTRKWYLYAAVKMFLYYLRGDDQQVFALDVLVRLNVNYDLEDIQSLIPQAEKETFSESLLKPGKRTRALFDNEGDVEELDGVIELFSNNRRWRRLAYWRKADTLRYDWERDPAEARAAAVPILDRLIEEIAEDPDADTLDWITIIRDRIWIHILDGTFDEGRALLARVMPERRQEIPVALWPLMIERARLIYAEDPVNADEAIEELEYFLSVVDPATPPAGIHSTHFGEACGVLGILYQRRGEDEEAQRVWELGRLRNWGGRRSDKRGLITAKGALMVLESESVEPTLAARTDGYTNAEWRRIVEELFAGSGLGDVAIRNMVFNTKQLPDEWIQTVAEKCFTGPRGVAVSDAALLHQSSLMQCSIDGMSMILYQAVLHLVLDGEPSLAKYPTLDPILFERCNRLTVAFQEQRIGWNEMAFVLAAFSGSWNERSFIRFRERLQDDELAAGFALNFGLMQKVKNDDPEKAREIVSKHVLPYEDISPPLYRKLAEDRLGEFD